MTKPLAIGFLCFSVTLAVLIGQRLSSQAMAVIVGSVIGVVSSVPMVALILWMLLRQRDAGSYLVASAHRDYTANAEAPRMIVIQPQPYAPAPLRYPMLDESSQLNMAGWDAASRRAHGGAAGGEPVAGWDAASRRAHSGAAGGEPVAGWAAASCRAHSRASGCEPATSWRQMRQARDFTIIGEEEFEDENRNALV